MHLHVNWIDPSLSHLIFCISSYHRQLSAGLQLSLLSLCPLQTALLPSSKSGIQRLSFPAVMTSNRQLQFTSISELHHDLFSSCTPSLLLLFSHSQTVSRELPHAHQRCHMCPLCLLHLAEPSAMGRPRDLFCLEKKC